MNDSVIVGAAVIFEGVTGQGRALTRTEASALKVAGVATSGGDFSDLKVFEFTVTKGWKATARGQKIEVIRNTYWGDSFASPGPYLVVGVQGIDGLYVAPLCGNTMHLGFGADLGHLKTLERLIGADGRPQAQ